jgi:hypothetical protein
MALAVASLMSPLFVARAQDTSKPNAVGIVYYADADDFKALDKEAAPQSGRSNYSAKVKGAHATVRLKADEPLIFRVCGVDPTRFKLYRFKSEENTRTVAIARNNMLIGGSKTVLSESEIPLVIQTGESGCFTLKPQKVLENGEFGFSPLESLDAFMFGVGDAKQSK